MISENNKLAFLLTFSCFLFSQLSSAQKNNDQQAMLLLDKAMGNAIETCNVAIFFESIAFGLKDPTKIFNVPGNKLVKGGFIFIDGKNMEMQLGSMKNLSDGKITVVVDEATKTMFIDSLRDFQLMNSEEKSGIDQLLTQTIGDGNIKYEGEESINNKLCHRIKSYFENEQNNHVCYWIEKKTGHLYLMAEWQNNAYDVYWIRRINEAPKEHEYSINLPTRELENYYGYMVIDHRYSRGQLNSR